MGEERFDGMNSAWVQCYLQRGDYLNAEQMRLMYFVQCNERHPDRLHGKIAVFSEPIEHSPGFRIIPNFPRYAVSKDGTVIDRVTNEVLIKSKIIKLDYYPTVNVINERTGHNRSVGIHRLVAMAWCPNDDYHNKVIVNHKDGNKGNYLSSNLEWATYSDNAIHAFQTGLRKDCVSCRIRNRETGEVKEFYSLEEMGRFLGLTRGREPRYFENGPAHRLINKLWEVRVDGDDRPWYYEVGEKPVPKSRYITTVTYPDGRKEVYWDNRDIIKKFKCWNISCGIDSVIAKARELNPDLVFEVEDRWKDRVVQTLNVETMEVVDESPWVRNATKLMNCSRGTVENLLRNGEQRPKNGHVVRYKPKEETPWEILPEEFVGQPVRIQLTNVETGESNTYESLRAIERELKISRFISKKFLNTGLVHGKYRFNEINYSSPS